MESITIISGGIIGGFIGSKIHNSILLVLSTTWIGLGFGFNLYHKTHYIYIKHQILNKTINDK